MTADATLIGFGEAGQAFAGAEGWQARARVFDKLTDRPETREGKQQEYRRSGVEGAGTAAEALFGSSLILSLVTADQALVAAREAASAIAPRALYCDMNSVSPETKRAAAAAIEGAGASYLDVAIMAPVYPSRLAVPLLVSGADASAAAREIGRLGFTSVRIVGDQVGQASAIKMIRSVIVKGLEALTAEAMLAADAAGVAEEVLASLDASDKAVPWVRRADYYLDRMIVHGLRRADEMEEAVKTLEDLGVEPRMTRATVLLQREIGALQLGASPAGLSRKLDQINGRRAA